MFTGVAKSNIRVFTLRNVTLPTHSLLPHYYLEHIGPNVVASIRFQVIRASIKLQICIPVCVRICIDIQAIRE